MEIQLYRLTSHPNKAYFFGYINSITHFLVVYAFICEAFTLTRNNNKYDNGKYNKSVLAIVLHENCGHKCQHYYKCKISSISMPFGHDKIQFFDELETTFYLKMF